MTKRIVTLAVISTTVLSFAVLMIRDPYVRISAQYELMGASPESQINLYAIPGTLDQESSQWVAFKFTESAGSGSRVVYELANEQSGEFSYFESEQEWRAAANEKDALFRYRGAIVSNVSGYAVVDSLVVGQAGSGFFILEMEDDERTYFGDRVDWAEEIRERTGISSFDLHSPHDRFALARWPLQFCLIVAGVLTACLVLITMLWDTGKKRTQST